MVNSILGKPFVLGSGPGASSLITPARTSIIFFRRDFVLSPSDQNELVCISGKTIEGNGRDCRAKQTIAIIVAIAMCECECIWHECTCVNDKKVIKRV